MDKRTDATHTNLKPGEDYGLQPDAQTRAGIAHRAVATATGLVGAVDLEAAEAERARLRRHRARVRAGRKAGIASGRARRRRREEARLARLTGGESRRILGIGAQ